MCPAPDACFTWNLPPATPGQLAGGPTQGGGGSALDRSTPPGSGGNGPQPGRATVNNRDGLQWLGHSTAAALSSSPCPHSRSPPYTHSVDKDHWKAPSGAGGMTGSDGSGGAVLTRRRWLIRACGTRRSVIQTMPSGRVSRVLGAGGAPDITWPAVAPASLGVHAAVPTSVDPRLRGRGGESSGRGPPTRIQAVAGTPRRSAAVVPQVPDGGPRCSRCCT